MSDSATRDALIERCHKLSAMTIAAGASENEAALAAKLLAKLVAEHNIQATEYTLRRDAAHCDKGTITIIEDSFDWGAACWAIQALFETKAWYKKRTEDILDLGLPTRVVHINYFGLPQDVAAALALTEIVGAAINVETITWAKATRTRAQLKLKSFRIGMAERLAERIKALKPQAITGTALVVLKNQLVMDEFAKLGLKMRRAQASQVADAGAFHAGQARAEGIRLGVSREVHGQTRSLSHG